MLSGHYLKLIPKDKPFLCFKQELNIYFYFADFKDVYDEALLVSITIQKKTTTLSGLTLFLWLLVPLLDEN